MSMDANKTTLKEPDFPFKGQKLGDTPMQKNLEMVDLVLETTT